MRPEQTSTGDRRKKNRAQVPVGGREAGTRGVKSRTITREQYESIFQIYLRNPSISRVQEASGVSYQTAKKAVEEGWPERGFEAIRDRFARVAQEAQRREENDPKTVIGENLVLIRKVKGRLRDAAETPDVSNAELIRLTDSLDKVLTREHSLLQVAVDAGIGGGGGVEDRIATLDDAALEALALRGEVPAELFSYMAPGYVPERDPDSHQYAAPVGSVPPKPDEPPQIAEDLPDLLAPAPDLLAPPPGLGPRVPQPPRAAISSPTRMDGTLDLESLSGGTLGAR